MTSLDPLGPPKGGSGGVGTPGTPKRGVRGVLGPPGTPKRGVRGGPWEVILCFQGLAPPPQGGGRPAQGGGGAVPKFKVLYQKTNIFDGFEDPGGSDRPLGVLGPRAPPGTPWDPQKGGPGGVRVDPRPHPHAFYLHIRGWGPDSVSHRR
jgi:hypothetical protein